MASSSAHIIRHAELNLQVAGKATGMEAQKEAGHWMESLFEKLEPALNTLAGDGSWLSLDKLEIEVQVNGDRWQEEALEKVTARIVEAITLHATHAIAETDFRSITPALHFSEIFLFYLQQGYLPWNTGSEIRTEWAENVKQLFEQKEPVFANKLVAVLKQHNGAKQRLLTSVPWGVLVKWMYNHVESFGADIRMAIRDVHQLITLDQKTSSLPWGKEIEASMLNVMINAGMNSNVGESILGEQIYSGLLPRLKKSLAEIEPTAPFFLKLQEIIEKKSSAEIKPTDSPPSISREKQKPDQDRKEKKGQPFIENLIGKPADTERSDAHAGIYIRNAGLVIVAPFLPMLFKNLGVWVDGQWHYREKAVCLIHYLATGNTAMEEFELVLPKLLCGMDTEEVVDPIGFLPDEIWIREANELLKSVIEYWSILKDTSVDGLRGSFLAREGRLQRKGSDWQLLVEQKPFDMLLQQLPWNISMLQLPWMEGMLCTDWV